MHRHDPGVVDGFLRSQFVDQLVDRFDYRVERIFVPGQQHPAGKAACPFLVEGIEREVDHFARAAQPCAAGAHGILDRLAHRGGEMRGKRLLQA